MFLEKISIGRILALFFIMLVIVILGSLMVYFNWGISTGFLWKPDSETILLTKIQIYFSAIIVTIGWVIACIIKTKSI